MTYTLWLQIKIIIWAIRSRFMFHFSAEKKNFSIVRFRECPLHQKKFYMSGRRSGHKTAIKLSTFEELLFHFFFFQPTLLSFFSSCVCILSTINRLESNREGLLGLVCENRFQNHSLLVYFLCFPFYVEHIIRHQVEWIA